MEFAINPGWLPAIAAASVIAVSATTALDVSRRHAWVNKQRGEGTINRFAHFSLPLQRQSGLSSAPTKRSRCCADCFRPVINLLNHTLMTYTHLTSSKCIPKFVIVTRLQGYRMMEAVSALQRCTEISPTTSDVSSLIVIRTAAGGRGTCGIDWQ